MLVDSIARKTGDLTENKVLVKGEKKSWIKN